MSDQRAGWYDDPEDSSQLRYWDGVVWTDNRVPKEAPRREPEPDHSSRPDHPVGAARMPQPSQQQPGGQYPYTQYPRMGQLGMDPLMRNTTPDGATLATWFSRVAAWLIDGFLILAVSVALSRLFVPEYLDAIMDFVRKGDSSPEAFNNFATGLEGTSAKVVFLSWVVATLYCVPLWLTTGKTLGKMALGIEVRRADKDERISFGAAMLRRVIPLVAAAVPLIAGAPAMLGLLVGWLSIFDGLWPLWDSRKQALHDKMAGSVVVKSPPRHLR